MAGRGGARRGQKRETYKVIKLNSCDAAVNSGNNLLRYLHRVHMLRVEPVTKSGDSGGDLVELNALLASIWRTFSNQAESKLRSRYTYLAS